VISNKKIVFFANTDWYLYNFILSLLNAFKEKGWEVVAISPKGNYSERLVAMGIRWISFDFSTKSMNPLKELSVLLRLVRLFKEERPSIIHNFTIKCVLYGSIAAKFTGGIPVVNAVTGLGYIFTDKGFKVSLVRPLIERFYKYAFTMNNIRVIFQNEDDRSFFVKSGLVDKDKTIVIRGSGVDCEWFKPVHNEGGAKERPVQVLFASRMIREKGVYELIEAARILKKEGVPVEFLFAGGRYPENPSSLTADDIENIKKEGVVQYLGHVDDMPQLISESDIVALPSSYREGTPRILIEAAAMEKPVVATDIPGCRGLVKNEVNGILVPVNNVNALVNAIRKLVENNELRVVMGRKGREIVKEEFDESIIVENTLNVYKELIGHQLR
jgi:glycosyltransferase involved in cell wall biosynthesis